MINYLFLSTSQKAVYKLLERFLCIKWYKLRSKEQKAFLNDVRYFPETLTTYILMVKPVSINDYINILNNWLILEYIAINAQPKEYIAGKFYYTLVHLIHSENLYKNQTL